MNEIEALTILASTPGLGPIKSRHLLHIFGSATSLLETETEELRASQALPMETIRAWNWWKKDHSWLENLELAAKHEVQLIAYTSPSYPKRLLDIHDHPLLLYVKGNLEFSDCQSIAVVGTRAPTLYGKEMAEKLSCDIASHHYTIVSGLARGIDTAAHEGALRSGRTIGVIGSGLANLYPKENSALAQRISSSGAIISEFPMSTPPERQNFPQRNRIVSGMTLGTLLIEAPQQSGAMITMQKALDQGRRLFAIPGRADHLNFEGNHSLIKKGYASLVVNAGDVLSSFESLFTPSHIKRTTSTLCVPLDNEEKKLWELMPEQEIYIEDLLQITKLPVIKLNILLMSLVMKKIIKEYPGKIYKKN